MLKNFELVLDLLNIDVRQRYIDVANKMLEDSSCEFTFYNNHGFVFEAFDDLLKDKISLEDFISLGDEGSNIIIKVNNNNPDIILKSLAYSVDSGKEAHNNKTFFVFDEMLYLINKTIVDKVSDKVNILFC